MHSMQHIFAGDAVYAPPVLRAPSPSSSIGTDYGPDETSLTQRGMSAEAFKRQVIVDLGLEQPREEEVLANKDPLIPRVNSQFTEKQWHNIIMINLRKEVLKLQEDEIFERTILRGSSITDEPSSSNDIDAIMRSMMGTTSSSRAPTEPTGSPPTIVSPVPSNASLVGTFAIGSNSDTSTTSASKRPSKIRSKGKNKRA